MPGTEIATRLHLGEGRCPISASNVPNAARPTTMSTTSIVFLDSTVNDIENLTAGLPSSTEWFVLDPAADGLAQMAAILARYDALDSIQIVSHGAEASLLLGSSNVTLANIDSYADRLAQIGRALSTEGDILLYGCNVAQGARGRIFIDRLSQLTQADVAASSDRTGSAELGGNSILEASVGAIETTAIDFSTYGSVLAANTAPTFLIGSGKVKTDLGASSDVARDMAVQTDGKIVVVGDDNGSIVLTRYNADGSLDTGFSGDGKVLGASGASSGVALLADGRILVSYSSGGNFQLARYSTNGALETTVTVDFGSTDQANDVTVQADGGILISGTSNGDVALARLTTGLALDSSFDGDGRLTTNVAGADEGRAVAVQTDGKILVAGPSVPGANSDFALVRYTTTGALDTTFGTGGKAFADFGGAEVATGLAVQSDGKIVVVGYTNAAGGEDFALARFDANGTLDKTFSGDGKATTNFGNNDRANSVLIQSDGKIVVAGSWDGGASDFAIARYNTDGTLDTSFSGDGLLNLTFSTTSFFGQAEFATSIKQQADGKLLVVGYTNSDTTLGDNDFALARINADGSLDTTFSADGKLTTDVGGSADVARDSALQADGKLVVAGSVGGTMALTRYNPDGSLDTSLSGDGKAFGVAGAAYAVALQADGKIVIAGDNAGSLVLTRFNTNGGIDTSFGTGGTKIVPMGGTTLLGRDLLVQSDGSIVLVGADGANWSTIVFNSTGTATASNSTSWGGTAVANAIERQIDGKYVLAGSAPVAGNIDFAVGRYSSSGLIDLDTTFNTTGRVTIDFGGTDVANAVALQSDGKIIVAGYTTAGTSGEEFALARLNANGTLDTTFDGDGRVTTNFGNNDRISSIVIQSDGKIIAAGSWDGGSSDFAIARYNTNGSLDTTFSGDGRVNLTFANNSFFGGAEFATSVRLQADGKILVVGYTNSETAIGDNDFAIARLNADGSFDTTFNISVDTLGGSIAFTEQSVTPVALDGNVVVTDAELTATNYSGATLTLARNGGANAQDVFSAIGALSALTEGNALVLSGVIIGGIVQNSNGTLSLSFNSNATQSRVNQALSSLAYLNTSNNPAASVQLDWTFNDGNTGAQGTGGALTTVGSTVVNITRINDAPTAPSTAKAYTNPNITLTFALQDFGFIDAEDANLTSVRIDTIPTTGNLRFDGFNVTTTGVEFSAADILAGRLTFAPGTTGGSFQYKVKDSGGLFNVALSTMNVSTSGETWNGTSGDDTHTGTPLVDSLNGLGGGDTIFGGGGGDNINGGDGNDRLNGGAGADTLDGGADLDTADYSDATTTAVLHLDTPTQYGQYASGTGGAVETDILIGIENLTGGSAGDYLYGDAAANVLTGNGGNDYIAAWLGGDTIFGGAGQEFIDGSYGADIIDGGADGDTIYGGADNDVIHGGEGNDFIYGDHGADQLFGDAGTDVLFVDSADTAYDGGADIDYIVWQDVGISASLDITAHSADYFYGYTGNDVVTAVGASTRPEMHGGGGGDTLTGSATVGSILLGEAGNDRLIGGTGIDHFVGGADADTYVVASGGGVDYVYDFVKSVDKADFTALAGSGIHSLADLTVNSGYAASGWYGYGYGTGALLWVNTGVGNGALAAGDALFA